MQLTNYKEQNNNIVQAYNATDIGSRILAILFDEKYDLPKKSAAFEVFKNMQIKGIEAGNDKYQDLKTNYPHKFYFKNEEFITLANKFAEINNLSKAIEMLKLIPDDKNAAEMLKKLNEELAERR